MTDGTTRGVEGPPRPARILAIAGAATLALLALDLATKEWALHRLSGERITAPPEACEPDEQDRIEWQRVRRGEIVVVEGYAGLRYAENCGAAFGLMRSQPKWMRRGVFVLAAVAASVFLGWMLWRGRGGRPFVFAVPLIVSGALGNLVDRVRHGYVVDFVRLHWRDGPEWPTFNVADVGITVGVALLLIDGLRQETQKPKEPTKTD